MVGWSLLGLGTCMRLWLDVHIAKKNHLYVDQLPPQLCSIVAQFSFDIVWLPAAGILDNTDQGLHTQTGQLDNWVVAHRKSGKAWDSGIRWNHGPQADVNMTAPGIAGGIPQDALTAIWALTDFHYHSQAPKLTDVDITKLTASLQEFHDNKAALMDAGARGTLDHCIRSMGTLGQWSADITEHAHITIIKDPAQSGNNQNFDTQICWYLDHQEKCQLFMQAMTAHKLDLCGDSDDLDVSDGEEDLLGSRKITDYFK
ncbi:hypothetical protein EDC04DRAFT_2606778 [Pisolithus marmoratus]|nr:hypothetical protein EDC04DRAFT_2606778 [Pisolithus marmoratus]